MTAVLATLASFNSVAQSDSEPAVPQWYQIELLVFTYQNSDSALQELWPQQPGLHYPERIITLSQTADREVMLNNPAPVIEPAADSQQLDANSDKLSFDAAQQPEQELDQEREQELPATSSDQDGLTPQQLLSTDAALTDEAVEQQTNLPEPLLVQLGQQPFTLLEPEQLQLQDVAKRLSRQGDIKTLFHGAWRQPIAERELAESILIQGGDQYDNHFELEGSVSIGLERYLHIKTDLWLSSFVSNAGQPQNLWPVLPPRPISSHLAGLKQQSDPFQDSNSYSFSASNNPIDDPFSELAANQYRVDRTVALQQDRRMRSQELHYIDHPLIGLLVKITPYEFPLIETVEPDINDSAIDAIEGVEEVQLSDETTLPVIENVE
jgi:hypothetical protein